jgi:hypothetical protein
MSDAAAAASQEFYYKVVLAPNSPHFRNAAIPIQMFVVFRRQTLPNFVGGGGEEKVLALRAYRKSEIIGRRMSDRSSKSS